MGATDDAGDVLQYIYLNRGEPLTDEAIAEASGPSLVLVGQALVDMGDQHPVLEVGHRCQFFRH
ncbi:MAG: hypothetical protein ABEI97_04100 [Candidatus Nanohaloarchaea archaeon]